MKEEQDRGKGKKQEAEKALEKDFVTIRFASWYTKSKLLDMETFNYRLY